MFSIVTGFFSSTKNILISLGGLLISAYVLLQKYKTNKAENKVKGFESGIAKANETIIKNKAKLDSDISDIEHKTEVSVLKDKNKSKDIVKEEITNIKKSINKDNLDIISINEKDNMVFKI